MVEVRWVSLAEADPKREFLALVTYLPRRGYWSIFNFFRQSNAIQDQLKVSKGLIGYSLRLQLLGKKAWTLSVWEDEGALGEFVGRAPHVNTMQNLAPQLGEARKFVRWKVPGSKMPPNWEEALERLKNG